jgi:hypothetical protein
MFKTYARGAAAALSYVNEGREPGRARRHAKESTFGVSLTIVYPPLTTTRGRWISEPAQILRRLK